MAESCPYHGGHEVIIKRLGEDVEELFAAKDSQTRTMFELKEKCTLLDKYNNDVQEKLNDHDKLIKAISEVTNEMRINNAQLSELIKNQESDRKRIDVLEQQPAIDALAKLRRVKEILLTVIVTSMASGTIAYVIALSKLIAR